VASVFFTGFPGFLGSELLPRILGRGDDRAICLVQPKFRAMANERARDIETAHPNLLGRIEIVEGDITRPLTINVSDVREVYHLAAVYDLSVTRELGMRVNVDGTRNVLDLAARAPRLERLHYVSTCYVSGRYDGRFTEDDLEKGQTFNNFYEETKQLAEIEVRRAMADGLPATIYRPSVVVGDSATGATQKFDGPYFVIQWLLRQPRVAVLPVVGRPSRYKFNMVPRDYVIGAMEYLSSRPESVGRTYALADPEPLTVDETIRAIAEATGRTIVRVPLTLGIAKAAIDYVPGVFRLMRIPSAAVNYFVHPTTYDTTNTTRDLAASGIAAPRVRDYLANLIGFAKAHPEVGSGAMV
jgi:nucleoside-diphosphate-sugar epimerase